MTTIESLLERLLAAVPELQPVYDEHIADNDGLLPHVLFGDVTRFAVQNAATPSVANLLTVLDEALSDADAQVREVVLASFVENCVDQPGALALMKPKMGLNLRRAFASLDT